MVTLVALVTVQDSVAEPPAFIVAGLTVSSITGRSCLDAGAGILMAGCSSTTGLAGVVAAGVDAGVDAGGVMHENNTSGNKINKKTNR